MGGAESAGRPDQRQARAGVPGQHQRQSERRLGVGNIDGIPGPRRSGCAGTGSDAHRDHRNLRAAVPRIWATRRRHRPRRRVLGVARERPPRKVRSQQMQGPLNGPNATGKHCPEGWTLYRFPGPQFRDVQDDGSVEASYYTWVDWFDTFGLGKNVPIASGNMSDAYFALVDGKWVTLRVPYPMGFYAKWSEG